MDQDLRDQNNFRDKSITHMSDTLLLEWGDVPFWKCCITWTIKTASIPQLTVRTTIKPVYEALLG